jgi:tetratricopeptide (TPR) repeat protein
MALPKRLSSGLTILFLLTTVLVLTLLTYPHLVSAYHLEVGGRAAEDCDSPRANPSLAWEHLQKAIDWEPSNAQAHRLLARVCRAQGEWLSAGEALARYTELRPQNPLGYLELAEIYEEIEAQLEEMYSIDLLGLLPGAEVAAPDVVIETPFGQPGEPSWRYYVAETKFSLPPNYGDRPTLFMHSPSRVTYTLELPLQPAILLFDMGMDPQAFDWPGDGVTFEVAVNGDRLFFEHVDKAMARRGWHGRTVDLAPWVGQEVALTLVVTPGPAADTAGDWAGWGEPQVVDARLPGLEALNPSVRMVQALHRAGLTAGTAIHRAETARLDKRYDEAMVWFQRAMRLEPDLADPWYYVGLLHEDQEQWHQALAAYEEALALGGFRNVGRSSPNFRMGLIYQRRLDPPLPQAALTAYQASLRVDDFSTQKEAAWAHARLGQSYYLVEKAAAKAEAEILLALEMAPRDKWLYFVMGDLYRAERQAAEAAAMYQQALEIDPDFEAVQRRLGLLGEGE